MCRSSIACDRRFDEFILFVNMPPSFLSFVLLLELFPNIPLCSCLGCVQAYLLSHLYCTNSRASDVL